MNDQPLIQSLPPPAVVRDQLANALREVELLRRLLRLSERAEQYRHRDLELNREEAGNA